MADINCFVPVAGGSASKKADRLIHPASDEQPPNLNPAATLSPDGSPDGSPDSSPDSNPDAQVSELKVSELRVHSKDNCYRLDTDIVDRLQHEIGVSVALEPGINLIQISADRTRTAPVEPPLMLWIYGGKVINQKTGVMVTSTWSTLNGLDDTLTLEVIEPAVLCACFFNADAYTSTQPEENRTVQLSIVRF